MTSTDAEPQRFLPHQPPVAHSDLPAVAGKIAGAPEDFAVDEIPLYAPVGSGEHLYARVEKKSYTTPAMLRAVGRAAGVHERDIGYAGLKDKHALTTQWISLPVSARDPAQWQLPEGIRVLETARHTNKLRTGHLSMNRFRIRLLTEAVDALGHAQAIVARLSQQGLLNYFGGQRFGRNGSGLGEAFAWLRAGARVRGVPRFLSKLYPSVIQAEVFNRYLSLRQTHGLSRLLRGEVVRLEGSGSLFVVEDPERELSRLQSGDIHLTGPIFGPKARAAASEALELEARTLAELELSAAELETLGRLAAGTRRDLVVRVADLAVRELEPGRLELEFSLPSGSYATELVRAITRGSFLIDGGERGAA
jgi:tRNA pseudouridine13 synthase